MLAEQILAGFPHGRDIERLRHPPCLIARQHHRRALRYDTIAIMTRERGKPRVKIGTRIMGRANRHRRRAEVKIYPVAHPVRLRRSIQINMSHLPARMHTGIRAPSPINRNCFTAK